MIYSVERSESLSLRIVSNSFRIHFPVRPFWNRHVWTIVHWKGEFHTNGKAEHSMLAPTESITRFIASVISQLSEAFECHVTFLRYCGIDVRSVGRIVIKAGFEVTGLPSLCTLRLTRTFE